MAVTPSVTFDEPGEALALAAEMTPLIAEQADAIDAAAELTPSVTHALVEAGFFKLLVPRSLGGREMDPPEYIKVVEALARADTSTAWCVNQGSVFATNAAFLAKPVARALWSDPGMVIANGPSPTALAEAVEGGYRVSGRWTFSSGCRHAPWLAGLAAIAKNGERQLRGNGLPVLRHMLLPREQAQIIEAWPVRGLRGTGSHHFEVKNLFVPDEHTVWNYADPVQEPGPLYAMPMVLLFACGFASVAVGTARAALEVLMDMAGAKKPRGVANALRDQPMVQMQVGQAEATLGAARAYLHHTLEGVWQAVSERGEITVEERVALRMATTHAIRLSCDAVDAAYTAAGSDAIYDHHPMQRRFQDMHVITQHVQGRLAHYESVGRFHLGLKPDMMWL